MSDSRLELINLAVTGGDGIAPMSSFYIDLVYDDADFKIKYSTDNGVTWNDYVKGSIVTPPPSFNMKVAVILPNSTALVKKRSLHGIVLVYD